MMIPTVHMNGTAKTDLIDQLCEAGTAISAAIRAMQNCTPNGRDYYPQGPAATGTAIAEHHARIDLILSVQRDLQTICERIDES